MEKNQVILTRALSGCPMASVLVVDDEVPILHLLRKTLGKSNRNVLRNDKPE